MNAQQMLDERAAQMLVREPDWAKWTDPQETAKVREAATFHDQVKASFLDPGLDEGYDLPWQKASDFKFRSGEMTIWTGYNGHKKSMVMGQVMLGLMAQGAKVCICSLEMKPVKSLKRIIRQYVGTEHPTVPYMDRFFDWAAGGLWFYDHVGAAKAEKIIALARYAISEIGVEHVVIDSLMKCGIGGDDLDRQKWFVDSLHSVAHDTNAHIHLVAHSKKPQDGKETIPSTKYQVAGSADITNIPDNVMVVFANKTDKYDYDLILQCEKQREGESEPKYTLSFDSNSLQHKPYAKASVMSCEDWERCLWR